LANIAVLSNDRFAPKAAGRVAGAALVQLVMPSRAQSKNANATSQDCSTLSARAHGLLRGAAYAKSYRRGRQSAAYPWPFGHSARHFFHRQRRSGLKAMI